MLHRIVEAGVRQPVRRPGFLRQEAARHLVLALGAAFEPGDLLGDAKFQRLVVGRFEMQAGHMLQRAPVAAVQRAAVVHRERRGDGFAVALGHGQEQVVRHGLADAQEEIEIEIGRGVMRGVGMAVAAVEEAPVGFLDFLAAQGEKAHALLGHLAPFGQDVLAFLAVQRGGEFVKAGVALVMPVELHAAAQQEAGIGQRLGLLRRRIEDMGGGVRPVLLQGLQRRQQRRARRFVACQQAAAAYRRERNGRQQLGVVRQAVALVGLGPGPVEHLCGQANNPIICASIVNLEIWLVKKSMLIGSSAGRRQMHD